MEGVALRIGPSDESTDTGDHLAGAIPVSGYPCQCPARVAEARLRARQPTQTGSSVGNECRQRLIDLVRDRGHQLTQSDRASRPGELRLHTAQRLFTTPELGDVLDRPNILSELIRVSKDGMAPRVNTFYRAIRTDNTVFEVNVDFRAHRSHKPPLDAGTLLRVNHPKKHLVGALGAQGT